MHINKHTFHEESMGKSLQGLNKLFFFLTQVKVIYNKIPDIGIASNKQANLVQILLVLLKLKNNKSCLWKMLRINENNKQPVVASSQVFFSQRNLKPASTVTGFKKFMYSSVKLSQNQLKPSYNRRKYNHSHYNQILKEITRLSRIYAYLSKTQMKNYCGFAVKPRNNSNSQRLIYLLKRINLPGKITEKVKTKKLLNGLGYSRPIPKMVNFLESRLDVIIWRNQLSTSIRSARQQGPRGLKINGSLQKKASYQTLSGDVFTWLD